MKLVVLHILSTLAGGGAERQLVELAAALNDAGVDVHLAYLSGGPNLDPARLSGATLHPLHAAGNHDPRVTLQLRALIKRLRPVVVQTWLLHADVFGGVAAKSCGVPWLLAERSSAAMYDTGPKFRLRRWLGRRADGVVANSDGGLAYWHDAGFTGTGRVIRNIVRMDLTGPAGESWSPSESPRILAVGRLSEEKNYPLLLSALEQVFSGRPQASACILGEGPARAALETQIAASPVLKSRVTLPGYVSDVAMRLAEADLCVSLSRYEGTPNTVIEAVAQGCPLLLSDIPAHREWLTDEQARWVPLGHPAPIAAAISAALADLPAARARVRSAHAQLAAWAPDRIAAEFIALYQQLTPGRMVCASS